MLKVQLVVPPVMLLLASRVTVIVIVAVPVPFASGATAGLGRSLAPLNCAVKMSVLGLVGCVGGLSLPQAAIVTAHARSANRFIASSTCLFCPFCGGPLPPTRRSFRQTRAV